MQSIPETTGPFFQEYNFEDLDPEGDRDLVIERLLAYGNREEVRWAFFRYGKECIKDWLVKSGTQRLTKRRYRMWCVILNVAEIQGERRPIWPH